jgi:hypothetical protein
VTIAQRKLPRGSVYEADMTAFELGRRYDVVACLFRSIGYVRTLENVQDRANGIEHSVESHELGLFTTEELLECFRRAGLHATHDPHGPEGRGLFLARRNYRTRPSRQAPTKAS